MTCKEEKLASMREANSKGEASVTADQQKKLHEKVDKCKQDSQKVRAFSSNTPVGSSLCKKLFPAIKPKADELTSYFKYPSVIIALASVALLICD